MSFALGESELTSKTLVELSNEAKPKVSISKKAYERVAGYRKIVEDAVKSDETYYGINTGFGFLSNVCIEKDKLDQLQTNIVRSHACGVGDPVEAGIARAVMLLRAHGFILGHSGISVDTVALIKSFIDEDILPFIPEQGSVGASGDLAPLSHLALALIGEGEVFYKGQLADAATALKKAKLKPLKLGAKEGLSLINGTHFMTALGAFALEEAKTLLESAGVAAALSLDASRGTARAFDERIHSIRQQHGQKIVAQKILALFSEPDEIMYSHSDCGKVQDPYSFRCTPQVHGASWDCVEYVQSVVDRELNSVTDNPLVFENGDILSGGNFHGQPVSMVMDFLGIAVAELGSISEQRIQKLTNPALSGLPAFIVKDGGLNSGYMIPHVVAASLVSENKILAHPACVDSIPTSADKEDHVSMGPIAARKARKINRNVANVLAIEFLAAAQGIDLLAPLKPNSDLLKIHQKIREISPYMDSDRSLHKDIAAVSDWILTGGVLKLLDE